MKTATMKTRQFLLPSWRPKRRPAWKTDQLPSWQWNAPTAKKTMRSPAFSTRTKKVSQASSAPIASATRSFQNSSWRIGWLSSWGSFLSSITTVRMYALSLPAKQRLVNSLLTRSASTEYAKGNWTEKSTKDKPTTPLGTYVDSSTSKSISRRIPLRRQLSSLTAKFRTKIPSWTWRS